MQNRGHIEFSAVLAELSGMLETEGIRVVAASEYRLWVQVPDLPLDTEDVWEPLIHRLEERHADLGPVLSWSGSDAVIVLGVDSDSEAHAAQRGVDVVASTLHAIGLGDRYPAAVEVEMVGASELVRA